ncbi:MAG: hypothetical protein ACPGQQ_00820 [Candidatus Puniceispirillaceae bacterium]
MPRFTTIQQRFTQGELDPAMLARDDIDQYYGALATAQNILTLPQGGFKRRPGLEHIDRVLGGSLTKIGGGSITETAPNGGTAANGSDQNAGTSVTTTTNISTTDGYVVLHYDLASAQDIGVLYLYAFALTVSGTSDEFFLQVSTDNSAWTTVGEALEISTTAKDFTRRVHGSYRYVRLVRVGTTDLTTNKATLTGLDVATESGTSSVRCIDFEFNVNQTYKMVVSDKNIAIYQGTTYLIDIYADDLTSSMLSAIDWETDADTLLIFHEDEQTITLQRGSDNDIWTLGTVTYSNIPTYDFGSGAEAIWSSTRGWPRHGRFYQGRLWVDGGKSLPSRVYGSKVNDVFNFSFGTSLDDEAVGPLTDSFDPITGIYPGRNLMIFTSGEEYIIPQTFGDPITPTTAVMTRQTSIGSEEGFRPQEVEGGVMYIQRTGASIQEFIYDDTQQAFSNNFVSLLSSHLIKNPTDFALRKATSTEEGAYLLLVRSDGNLTVANILRSQGITSFVEATTDGSFKACGVDIDDMYFVVEREIDGETINWLERFNNDHYMDASTRVTTGLPTDTFTGLTHLEGEECRVLADGALLDNETVASGSVTIDRDAEESLEIGLNFTPTVTDLPASKSFGEEATIMGRKVNISEISLRLKDTAGILVNGKTVSFRGFGPAGGGSPFDVVPTRFTGVKRLLGWRGWSEDAQVTITQENPLPMTVLAIKKRINT